MRRGRQPGRNALTPSVASGVVMASNLAVRAELAWQISAVPGVKQQPPGGRRRCVSQGMRQGMNHRLGRRSSNCQSLAASRYSAVGIRETFCRECGRMAAVLLAKMSSELTVITALPWGVADRRGYANLTPIVVGVGRYLTDAKK